jgi:hypothetical protein
MLTRTHRIVFAALALLSLTTLSSTLHTRAAAPSPHVSTQQRYTLPASVAGCPPLLYTRHRYSDGTTLLRFTCAPQGHSRVQLFYTLVVGFATPLLARRLSAQASNDASSLFDDPSSERVLIPSLDGRFWAQSEHGPHGNRVTVGGSQHRVVLMVTVLYADPHAADGALSLARTVSHALVARIP